MWTERHAKSCRSLTRNTPDSLNVRGAPVRHHQTKPEYRVPHALMGRVQANGTPPTFIAELTDAFKAFKASNGQEVDRINAALGDYQKTIDELTAKIGALSTPNGAAGFAGGSVDPEYTRTFASWARRGQLEQELSAANASGDRMQIRAAMNTGTGADGGFLAPVEWDRKITKALTSASVIRGLCTVIQTTVGGYSTLWNAGGWGSGWVGETASRPNTATPALSSIGFSTGEIYANPAVSQQLLEDAAFDLES